MPPSDKLIFVHIPRTGGGSLINVLDDHYDVADIAPFWNPQDFAKDETHDLSRYKLIRGHCGPNEIERVVDQGFSTITFLRDPLTRTASIYRWLKTLEVRDELADGALVAKAYGAVEPTFDPESQHAIDAARSLSFEEFVETDVAADFVSNGQTINLGTAPMEVSDYQVDLHAIAERRDQEIQQHTFPRAIGVLDRCMMVGIIEKYTQSVILLHYLMGWSLAPIGQNSHDTKAHASLTNLTDRARVSIERRNEADIALHQHALACFETQFGDMVNDLGTDDLADLSTAVNARYREKALQKPQYSSVQVDACSVWPGLGWSERQFAGPGEYSRLFGANNTVTLYIALDPTVDFGGERVLSLFLRECKSVDPSKNIYIEVDGLSLEFGGVGARTDQAGGLTPLYPYHWSLPFSKVFEMNGRLEISIRLVDVDSSALVSVGGFEVS